MHKWSKRTDSFISSCWDINIPSLNREVQHYSGENKSFHKDEELTYLDYYQGE